MRKQVILVAAYVAFAWNFIFFVAATLNISIFLNRAAGGHLDSIPASLRFAYGVQTLLVVFQMYFVTELYRRNGAWSGSSYLLARIFLVLSALSALVNSMSKSPAGHWNTIAGVIIVFGFYTLGDIHFRPTH